MRIVQPLRVRAIALLWGGLATSAVGDQLYNVAIAWIAVGVLGAAAGYLSAAQALIATATALLAGAWADARDDRRLMIAADLVRAGVLAALVALWLATGRVAPGGLVAAVFVLAAGQALFRPALQAVLPRIEADRALLPATNALLDSTERLARLVGPGLIALLAAILPPMHFLTLNAVTFAVSALAVSRIRGLRPRGPVVRGGVIETARQGFQAMRQDRLLRYMLSATGIHNGAWYTSIFLGVPLLLRSGDASGGIGSYGLVIASYGIGNVAANLAVSSRGLPGQPGRLIFAGQMVNGTGIVLLALATLLSGWAVLPALCAAAAISGAGGPMGDIPRAVLVQTLLPPGRVAGAVRAWMVVNNLGTLVAMSLAPLLVAAAGARACVAVCGLAIVSVGAIGLLRLAGHAPILQAAE